MFPVPPVTRPEGARRSGLSLGRVAGFPVRADWSVVVVAALLTLVVASVIVPAADVELPGWAAGVIGLAGAVAFLGSILVHELAHALAARRHGLRVEGISLSLFGGLAELIDEPRTWRQALHVSAAGPLASLALAVTLLGGALGVAVLDGPELLRSLLVWLGWANVVLGLFNLLPGLPLDGGRIVQALLWKRHGDPARATITAARAGRYVGLAVIGYGLLGLLGGTGPGGLWSVVLGWMILASAKAEAMHAAARRSLAGLRMRHVMASPVVTVPDYLNVATFNAEYVSVHGRSAYPVRSFNGRVVGLVSVPVLAALPAERRDAARLADLAVPAERLSWAQPDELVVDVLARGGGLGTGRILVGSPDDLLGIVTPSDIERAATRRALGTPLPPPMPLPPPSPLTTTPVPSTPTAAPTEVAHR